MEKEELFLPLLNELKIHLDKHIEAFHHNLPEGLRLHQIQFHRTFYKFADNQKLNKCYTLIQGPYDIVTMKYMNLPEHREKALMEHKTIFEAVKEKDIKKSVCCMDTHISNSLERLLTDLDSHGSNL